MIMTTYHDFRSLRWAIRPVCPTQTRDITSSGWVRTGSGGGRAGFGFGLPCSNDQIPMIMARWRPVASAHRMEVCDESCDVHGRGGKRGRCRHRARRPGPWDGRDTRGGQVRGRELGRRDAAAGVLPAAAGVHTWKTGDRVFGLVGGGGLADRVVVHERHVAAVPANLADDVAAAVPEAYITAHDAVFIQCGLQLGETLLVNGANGAVGSAGARLGLAAGARVVANVRSLDTARSQEKEGAVVVTPDSAAARVAELGGAHVVLELVGAPNLDLDFRVLAVKGRIVIVGSGAGAQASLSLQHLMVRRASLRGTVLRARPVEEKAAAVQAFTRSVLPLLAAG